MNYPIQISPVHLTILFLFVWRLSSLFSDENGPKDIFWHIRYILGVREISVTEKMYGQDVERQINHSDRMLGRMIMCVWCNSFWIGVVTTFLYVIIPDILFVVAMPFALSAAAIYISGARRYA